MRKLALLAGLALFTATACEQNEQVSPNQSNDLEVITPEQEEFSNAFEIIPETVIMEDINIPSEVYSSTENLEIQIKNECQVEYEDLQGNTLVGWVSYNIDTIAMKFTSIQIQQEVLQWLGLANDMLHGNESELVDFLNLVAEQPSNAENCGQNDPQLKPGWNCVNTKGRPHPGGGIQFYYECEWRAAGIIWKRKEFWGACETGTGCPGEEN